MTLIRRYGRQYGPPFVLAVSMVAFEALCDVLQPTLLAQLIDQGVVAGDQGAVWTGMFKMLAIALAGALFAFIRAFISTKTSLSWGARVRKDLYRSILSRKPNRAALDDPDSLLVRLTHDVTQTTGFFNGSMRIFVRAPLVGTMAVIMALRLDISKALVPLLIIPLVLAILGVSINRGLSLFRRAQEALDRFTAGTRRVLEGIRIIKAVNREQDEIAAFNTLNEELKDTSIRAQWHMARIGPHTALLVNLGIVALLILGWKDAQEGSFKPGAMIAFVNYMGQVLFALGRMTAIINNMVRAKVSASRIRDILDREGPGFNTDSPSPHPQSVLREPDCKTQTTPPVTDPNAITKQVLSFHEVGFTWPRASTPVLEHITFAINRGEIVTLVGATGSGKSSLVQLASGFQDPTTGCVIRQGRIALVPQQVNLFTGTIRSNLLWGRPDAVEDELVEAARASAALDFIMESPKGFDTPTGRGGITLSGGQKQRLSLARALLRRADLLILDDAMSAVDTLTEATIRSALRALTWRPAILIVAQRVAAARQADRVLVLDQGQLVANGPHTEILETSPVYRDIVASQSGLEADHV